jgi:hypothetical protein
MNLKNIILTAFVTLVLFSSTAMAYERYWSAEYQIGFSAFDHADFIEDPSFRGWAFQFSQEVTDLLSMGAYFGWNNFYEDLGKQTYSGIGHDKTVHIWRRTATFPVLFQPTILILPDSPIRPLASLGAGVYFTHKEELEGFWSNTTSGVNFGLRPEVGVQAELDRIGFKISGAFNGIFGNPGNVEGISAFSINAGIIVGM